MQLQYPPLKTCPCCGAPLVEDAKPNRMQRCIRFACGAAASKFKEYRDDSFTIDPILFFETGFEWDDACPKAMDFFVKANSVNQREDISQSSA
jgi:hypothetical protein